MLNEKKIEEIRKNIQTSTLLTDHEKSDWLNLLELMNDKQLSELEEILGATNSIASQLQSTAPAPAAAMPVSKPISQTPKPQVPLAPPIQKMPPLTHIANIPTDVTLNRPTAVKPSVPTGTTPTPSQTPPPPSPTSATPKSALPLKTTLPPVAPRPSTTPAPSQTPAAPSTQPVPPQRPSGITQPRYKAEKIEDIQEFSIDTIRTYDLQSVVDAVRALIQEHGYFKIVQYLEASPLYDSYINSGKERLRSTSGEQVSNNSLLTQEELEFMTDLLRHMRFNRW